MKKNKSWYGFHFRIPYKKNKPVKSWVDIYIIDVLFRQILYIHKERINLWRFHRRWNDDKTGHQLTLFCYINERGAKGIDTIIKNSKALKLIKTNRNLKRYFYKNYGNNIESTCDKKWVNEIQQTWPYFINGMSEMILRMIQLVKENTVREIDDDVESFYIRVNKRLIKIWRKEGRHAFFHHISALFGYDPILMTF